MPGKTKGAISGASTARIARSSTGWRGTWCGTPATSPGCAGRRSTSGKAYAGPPSRVAWPRTEKDRTRRSDQVDQEVKKLGEERTTGEESSPLRECTRSQPTRTGKHGPSPHGRPEHRYAAL